MRTASYAIALGIVARSIYDLVIAEFALAASVAGMVLLFGAAGWVWAGWRGAIGLNRR